MKTNFLLALACGAASQLLAAKPLDTLRQNPALKTASIGFALLPLEEAAAEDESAEGKEDLKKPQPLFYQPDLALTPASVQKALTTATALQILGPEFRFTTRLYRSGEDLIILGGGDPLLASTGLETEFPAWHKALLAAELSEVRGTLIADPSFFEDRTTPNEWLWGDIGNYYGAGPCGLNFHHNSFAITFQPGEVGEEAKVLSTTPRPPQVRFVNHITTGPSGSGDQGYAYSGPGRPLITLRGTVPAGGPFTIHASLPNPPLACAAAFRDYLRKRNFPVAKVEVRRDTKPKAEDLLHETPSPTLAKIIVPTNMRSVNLNAECLFKALTPQGSTAASQKTFLAHWEKQGLDFAGYLAHDGSGLSPQNTLTARQVATILKLTHQSEHGALFRASLPLIGRSGSLQNFGRDTAAEGRGWVKPGAMERVRTWAGYLKTRSGEDFAFALLINHYNGSDLAIRNAAQRFLAELCEP